MHIIYFSVFLMLISLPAPSGLENIYIYYMAESVYAMRLVNLRSVNREYFMESAGVRYLRTSC